MSDMGEHSQDRYYERYRSSGGGFQGPGPRRRRSRAWLAVGAAALVVILVAAVLVVALRHGSGSSDAVTPSSSSTSSNTIVTEVSPTTGQDGGLLVRPVVPGWQAVGGVVNTYNKIYAAYDAPPGWKVTETNGFSYADENGSGIAGQHTDWGLATLNAGTCTAHPSNSQVAAGFVDIGKRDPAEAVPDVLKDFASAVSLNKDKSTHAAQGTASVKTVQVAGGSVQAIEGQVTATGGTLNPDCSTGRTTTLYAVAFTSNSRSVMLLLAAATWPGHPLPGAGTIERILTSVRPAGG